VEGKHLSLKIRSGFLLTGLAAIIAASSFGAEIKAQLTTSFGRALDSAEPGTSFVFEPKLGLRLSPDWMLRFYSFINRPVDPHENFSVPSMDLSADYQRPITTQLRAGAFVQASAVDMHRWNTDGWVSRVAAGPSLAWQALPFLRMEATAAPFSQQSQYRTRADGQSFLAYGFAEEISLIGQWRDWQLEASIFLIQSRKRNWRNSYLSFQRLSYAPWRNLVVGVSHQLSDELVSFSTGLARPFGMSDARLSRLSGFVRWQI
jgi:hypothetical protein